MNSHYHTACGLIGGIYHGGKYGQDAVLTRSFAGGITAIGVADGAGSMPHSELASRFAVSHGAELFAAQFEEVYHAPDTRGRAVLTQLQHDLRSYMRSKGLGDRDGDTTLLLVLAHYDGRYLTAHVGDGRAFLFSRSNVEILSDSENYEGDSSVTSFLCHPIGEESLRVTAGQFRPYDVGVLLTSDGLQDFAEYASGLLGDIASFLSRKPDDGLLQKVVSIWGSDPKITIDDCSMAMLCRREEEGHSAEKRRGKLLGMVAEGNVRPLSRIPNHARRKARDDLSALQEEGLVTQTTGGDWRLA